MIKCFCGVPGSGKSYEAVQTILDAAKQGRKIYTNIDGFDDSECKEFQKNYCNLTDFQLDTTIHFLTKEQVFNFWEFVENGSLIVIDEIQLNFSNRDWSSEGNRSFVRWAEVHRHHGFDLIMLTHSTEKIDKHVRSLIDWTYVYDKVNYFGSLVKNRYTKNAFKFDQDKGKAIKSNIRQYDPAVFPCYKSYVSEDIKEMGIGQGINVLKHPIFLVIPVLIGLFIYLLVFKSSLGSGDLFGQKKFKDLQTSIVQKNSNNDNLKSVVSLGVPTVVSYRDVVETNSISKKVSSSPAGILDKNGFVDAKNKIDSMHPDQSREISCVTTGLIEMEGERIEIQRCGCLEKKLLNGKVVYEKLLSGNRCSSGPVTLAGASARRAGPPLL